MDYINNITEGLVLANNEIAGNPWLESGATGDSINLGGMWLLGNSTGADKTIYVNYTTGNDLTGDGTSGNPYKTITQALAALPRVIDHIITIQLQDADYVENPNVKGFDGKGTIIIQGNTATPVNTRIRGATTIEANKCQIFINKLAARVAVNSGKSIAVLNNPGIVEIKDSVVNTWSASYTNTIAIYASKSPFVLSTNNSDNSVAATVGLQAEFGATIIKNGTQPGGATSNEVVNTGGLIR